METKTKMMIAAGGLVVLITIIIVAVFLSRDSGDETPAAEGKTKPGMIMLKSCKSSNAENYYLDLNNEATWPFFRKEKSIRKWYVEPIDGNNKVYIYQIHSGEPVYIATHTNETYGTYDKTTGDKKTAQAFEFKDGVFTDLDYYWLSPRLYPILRGEDPNCDKTVFLE